ncbi:MAG: hypothetical protein HYS17_06865 [Micavibrio aeruginosavorus]|uniref:Lipoprotein n=1 Tax=Micavibrio aeruginosavorus TaxID=349221 RepID=A0A7T5R0H1_9BACT|nr:MAG: hypothetical protein HYS17_06865 [Micavibrio aeruginosavorus]
MNIAKRFLAASALAGSALLTGCASTGSMGLPDYRSVDAGERTANTEVSATGIRYNVDGSPVRVNYQACQALTREINNTNSGNATQRAINQGTGTIGSAVRRGSKGNVGEVALGAVLGVGVGILGDQATRAINSPRIKTLEADCNQQRAFEQWDKDNKAAQAQFSREFNNWQRDMGKCVAGQTRIGETAQVARRSCETMVGPAPVRP